MEAPTYNIKSSPKLIFLNYAIKKNSDDTKTVRFVNKIVTEGKLKSYGNKYIKTGHPGDLKCVQLDKTGKALHEHIIKNPLIKSFEYLNDSRSFEKKTVNLDSTSFSLRLQLNPLTKSIMISEIMAYKKNDQILIRTAINSL
ncbi:hypothetical protein [Snuella sedimenti]|nr:hypothetical protein [Snuella sedimenti]